MEVGMEGNAIPTKICPKRISMGPRSVKKPSLIFITYPASRILVSLAYMLVKIQIHEARDNRDSLSARRRDH